MRFLPVFLLLVGSAWADELVLKDGKRIEFKSLTDEGESWEVTTPQGTKVTVKKSDFAALVPSGLKDTPLTGASYSFDKKKKLTTVDLISKIDTKKDELVMTWKVAAGALTGTGIVNRVAKLQIPFTPPDEYDVTMVLECKDSDGTNFGVGLIGGGKQFMFIVGPTGMGLSGIDPAPTPGKYIPIKDPPKTLKFMVRRDAFIVQLEGKDLYTWKADWTKVSIGPGDVQNKNFLFLHTGNATFVVHRMILTTPKD